MAQQTAVEWLLLNLEVPFPKINEYKLIIELSKQMEKDQIIKAATLPREQRKYNALKYNNCGEQYYSETYEK